MGIISMKNGNGLDINVDPETVDSVSEVNEGISGLRIGGMTVAVQGSAEDVAGQIEKGRGRPCKVEKSSKNGGKK
jgi:hypothetical protein